MFTSTHWMAAGTIACCMVPAVLAAPDVYPTPQKERISQNYVAVKGVSVNMKPKKGVLRPVEGAYKIVVRENGTVGITAADSFGLYYAKQTLSQLLKGVPGAQDANRDPFPDKDIKAVAQMGKLPVCEIEDWPDIPFRGIVEGFYGPPGWTQEGRASLLRFLGRNKMNTFIYGPKGDPYHHGQWRKPYPADEAKDLQALNELAAKSGVRFVWAIHPGGSINWSSESTMRADFAEIVKKLELMYGLGIRNFGVFFDDISGDAGKPENQVKTMAYIVEHFAKKKKDIPPLIFCPSGYNRAWTNAEYLKTIGQGFDKSIMIMWTGDSVVHDISKQGQEWFTEQTGRPAFIWWNYPCCDFCRTNLTMGPLNDSLHPQALEQDPKMKELLNGMTSNPMDHSEASKIGVFSIGNYAWNITGFDSDKSWKDSIHRLFPECPEAMQVFCNHNSDLGPNGHGYRKDESVTIQPAVQKAVESVKAGRPDKKALAEFGEELTRMYEAAVTLQEKLPKTMLVESTPKTPDRPDAYKEYSEIGTWVKAFAETSAAGRHAVKSITDDKNALASYVKATEYLDRYAEINATYNQTPWQSGIKVCSRIVRPAIDALLEARGAELYKSLGGKGGGGEASFEKPSAASTAPGLARLNVDQTDKRIGIVRVMEKHPIGRGETITLAIPGGVRASGLEIDLGSGDLSQWAAVSFELGDGSRVPVKLENAQGSAFTVRAASMPKESITGVTLENKSGTHEISIEQFRLDVTSSASVGNANALIDGKLQTVFRLEPGASIMVACPPGARNGIVVTSGAVKIKIEGAESKASPGKVLFKLKPGAKKISVKSVGKGNCVVNEVIFR